VWSVHKRELLCTPHRFSHINDLRKMYKKCMLAKYKINFSSHILATTPATTDSIHAQTPLPTTHLRQLFRQTKRKKPNNLGERDPTTRGGLQPPQQPEGWPQSTPIGQRERDSTTPRLLGVDRSQP
jgi:hypothetical protein